MKSKAIKYLIIISIIVVSIFILLIVGLSKLDTDTTFKQIDLENNGVIINLAKDIPRDSTIIVKDIFQYKKYINSDNWKTVSSINNDLAILDSINPNHFNNLDALVNALTIKNTFWYSSNLDSLNMLMSKWLDKLNVDQDCISKNSLLYRSVFNYWMGSIANKMDSLSSKDESIIYSFKYKFIKERCSQSLHSPGVTPENNTTKILNYVIEQRWYYLFVKRFWMTTSISYKAIAFTIILITFLGYFFLISRIYYFFKKKSSHEK